MRRVCCRGERLVIRRNPCLQAGRFGSLALGAGQLGAGFRDRECFGRTVGLRISDGQIATRIGRRRHAAELFDRLLGSIIREQP